jgi:PilZ domain-containing protein
MSDQVASVEAVGVRKPQVRERRQFVRYPCQVEVVCRVYGSKDQAVYPALSQDVSVQGIGLILSSCLNRGLILEVKPQSARWETIRSVLARVRSATALPDGRWLIGCSFVRPLTEEELASWL